MSNKRLPRLSLIGLLILGPMGLTAMQCAECDSDFGYGSGCESMCAVLAIMARGSLSECYGGYEPEYRYVEVLGAEYMAAAREYQRQVRSGPTGPAALSADDFMAARFPDWEERRLSLMKKAADAGLATFTQ